MKTTNLIIATVLFLAINILPQNIDAKLGAGGVFDVKNANNNSLFSINEIDGAANLSIIKLPATLNSNSGIIYKNGITFLHAFGNNNIFLGYNPRNFTLTNANGNIAIGTATLNGLTTGVENTAVGNSALHSNTTGNYNSSFGSYSLEPNTTGNFNSAFGYAALRSNQTGYNNTAVGVTSLYNNTIGEKNTAIGFKSLFLNQSGFQNTAVGDSALYKNTGNYNTALGYNAGSNVTTGANLTLIGIDANPSSPTAFDEITLGNQYVQTLRCNATTITSLSDAEIKRTSKIYHSVWNF